MAGGKGLDPPLLVVLDEAANVAPLAELDVLASTAAGHGVQLVTVWQDLAQLNARYGQKGSSVVNNHRAKLFLSGIADPGTLEHASQLAGEEDRRVRSRTVDHYGSTSTTDASAPRRLVPPDALRRLEPGTALLLYAHLPPVPRQRSETVRSVARGRYVTRTTFHEIPGRGANLPTRIRGDRDYGWRAIRRCPRRRGGEAVTTPQVGTEPASVGRDPVTGSWSSIGGFEAQTASSRVVSVKFDVSRADPPRGSMVSPTDAYSDRYAQPDGLSTSHDGCHGPGADRFRQRSLRYPAEAGIGGGDGSHGGTSAARRNR